MGNNSPEVHAIHVNRRSASGPAHGASRHNTPKANPGSTQQKSRGQSKKRFQQRSSKSANKKCGNCGRLHDEQQTCPAKGKRCDTCNRWNHFAAMCRSTLNVNEVTTQPDQGGGVESDDFYIDSIDTSAHNPCETKDQAFRYLDLGPGRVPIKFKLDTGSQVNILPVRLFKSIGSLSSLKQPSKYLYDYSKSRLETLGEQKIRCTHGNRVRESTFSL